jgi:hypothetical protein
MRAMKMQRLSQILAAAVSLVLLNGCASYPNSGSEALVGNWTNSVGTLWMIKADGMFDVDLDKDGKRDAWGKWSVKGDTVTFVRKGGVKPKGCGGGGVYRFNRPTENTLHFILVKDSCKLRIKNVTLPWTRK